MYKITMMGLTGPVFKTNEFSDKSDKIPGVWYTSEAKTRKYQMSMIKHLETNSDNFLESDCKLGKSVS